MGGRGLPRPPTVRSRASRLRRRRPRSGPSGGSTRRRARFRRPRRSSSRSGIAHMCSIRMIAAAVPFGIASATYQASSSGIRWPSCHRRGAELGACLDARPRRRHSRSRSARRRSRPSPSPRPWLRSLTWSAVMSPSSSFLTTSASTILTNSCSRRRSSSAAILPVKFGSAKPSTSICTGPIAIRLSSPLTSRRAASASACRIRPA